MTTVLAPRRPPARKPLPDADQVMALAEVLYKGGLSKKTCNSPAAIAVRIVAGMEVGLAPVQAVNWIAVINGRAVIWGDAALALVRSSDRLDEFEEYHEGEGDDRVAVCVSKRKGDAAPRETRFSVADAKKANLWGKAGPWTEYPDRQLMWRARGWNLRDNFGDVLAGLGIAEEELDVPVKVAVERVTADPKPAAPAAAAPAPEAAAEVACPTDLLERIADARAAWLAVLGVNPDNDAVVQREWSAKLAQYGATSARQLPPDRAAALLADLADAVRPKAIDGPEEPLPGN